MLVYQRVCQDCQSTLSSWQLGDRNFAMAGPLLALAAKFLANLCILKQHFSCWRNMCLQVFVQGIIEDHIWSDIRPTSTFHRFLEGYQLYRVACRMNVNRWESETWSRNELQKAKRQEVQDSNHPIQQVEQQVLGAIAMRRKFDMSLQTAVDLQLLLAWQQPFILTLSGVSHISHVPKSVSRYPAENVPFQDLLGILIYIYIL